jgi:hypothetical protein
MNRWSTSVAEVLWAATACLVLFSSAGLSLAEASASPRGAAVFEMKYRGLSTPDDPLRYQSYWSFGTPTDGSDQRDPFVQAVKSRVKECTTVYNGFQAQDRWSVVELQDKKPVAFYFDVNGDGKLSENEKSPVFASTRLGFQYVFVTSDFMVPGESGREAPFRALVAANGAGKDKYRYLWAPHCVLEGQVTLAGVPMKLVLFPSGFLGAFTDFGRCSVALVPAEQKLEGTLARDPLSSLIAYQGAFYRLKVQGTHAKDSTVRVVLEKDTSPTGRAALTVAGKEGLKSRLTEGRLEGAQDPTIQLYLAQMEPTLPVGTYKMPYGSLSYGLGSDDEWRVTINEGPPFAVKAGETTRWTLGQPVLSIKAIDEKDRNPEGAKERSTFTKGTPIYLSLQIKGKAGELYMRFSQKNVGGNDSTAVRPHVAILDATGKLVASADMEYG